MTYDLVGLGNPVYDFIHTPKTKTSERILSGCSTNACLAAKRLGMKDVVIVGNVGLDFAQRFLREIEQYKIKAINASMPERTTGFSLRYDDHGDRTLKVIADAGKIPLKEVWQKIDDTRYLLLGPVLCEIDMGEIAELASNVRGEIFLDPQGLLRRVSSNGEVEHFCDREKFKKVVAAVDFVKPNELEAQIITGSEDHVESAKQLVEWGARIAVVTLGEKGSIACDQEVCVRIPAYKTMAVDPTGAGDVYGGAFLAEYSRNNDLGSACLYASAAASVMVESVGPDFPVTDELVRRRAAVIESGLEIL